MTPNATVAFEWPLMVQGVSAKDRLDLAEFLLNTDRLTMGDKVREFEAAWTAWQGCRYSVMVNSGSSANLLLVAALKELYGISPMTCQAVTWPTNVSPAVQLGMPLSLVDVNLKNFGPSLEDLERVFAKHKTKFLFLTHLLGFPAITSDLVELCKQHGVQIVEDCCESHGAQFQGQKVGNFGLGGTFSFYYGHHMSTIEGGMLSTNDKRLYETLLLLRSHGLLRELPSPKPTPGLDPRFTFLLHGYNVRPTELNGFLGLCQLPRLDKAIEIRNHNLKTWLSALDPERYEANFDLSGVSSFSLPLLVKPGSRLTIDRLKVFLSERGVENRPVVSGNICRQPFLKDLLGVQPMPTADYVHDNGLYIGNHAHLSTDAITALAGQLNSLDR